MLQKCLILSLKGKSEVCVFPKKRVNFTFVDKKIGTFSAGICHDLTINRNLPMLAFSPFSFFPLFLSAVHSTLKNCKIKIKCQVLPLHSGEKCTSPLLRMERIRIFKKTANRANLGKYIPKEGNKLRRTFTEIAWGDKSLKF